MCGINGIVNIKGNKIPPFYKDQVQIMNDTLAHRGPDSDGIFVKDQVIFGYRRLSIIDLSTAANQPMLSNDEQIVIVFNGEIYNYIEIRKELINNGHIFRTKSDTEVIINSYLEYGFDCVQKFNGMWAFAIFDFRKNILFCSRDRIGVKPFYYYADDTNLFFSSELKALHKVCNLQKANLNKVYEYLIYGYRVNDSETFFENCHELLPATNLIFQNNCIELHKYWELQTNAYEFLVNDRLSINDEFTQLLENSVKLRYRSDVPVGILLSGGLDSSTITKITDHLIDKGELKTNDIHAYIASFPDFKYDETAIARNFVKSCDHIKLHEIVIKPDSVIHEFDQIIYGFDHPVFSFTSVSHYILLKEIKQEGIKVVLNGQGSDEALAGYDRYNLGYHLWDLILSLNPKFLSEFHFLHRKNMFSIPLILSQLAKACLSLPYSAFLRAKYVEKSIPCFDRNFIKESYKHYNPYFKFSMHGNNLTNYMLHQIKQEGLNRITHYEDISSMQNSVEVRSPFLDYRFMQFCFSIPMTSKFDKGRTKIILRDTFGKMLSESIMLNRQKIGFHTPFLDYITNDQLFKEFVTNILHSKSFTSKRIWNAPLIRKVFENPRANPNFPFWRVINLELWSKVFNIYNL